MKKLAKLIAQNREEMRKNKIEKFQSKSASGSRPKDSNETKESKLLNKKGFSTYFKEGNFISFCLVFLQSFHISNLLFNFWIKLFR